MIYEITDDGKVIITGCNKDASGELVIPSDIAGYSVFGIGGDGFNDCDKLTSIVVSEGILYIENGTFHRLKSLRKITLPSTLIELGSYAFMECNALKEVHIANLNFYFRTIKSLDLSDEVYLPGGTFPCAADRYRCCGGSCAIRW